MNYIHGDFSDTESIVFGHSTHPERAFPELMEQKFIHRVGGDKSKRFRELYLVENALYETDKQVQDNIDDLCEFMTIDGVHIEDITDIYVLGHSFERRLCNTASKIGTSEGKYFFSKRRNAGEKIVWKNKCLYRWRGEDS